MEIKDNDFWDLSPCSVLDAYIRKIKHGVISEDPVCFTVSSVPNLRFRKRDADDLSAMMRLSDLPELSKSTKKKKKGGGGGIKNQHKRQ